MKNQKSGRLIVANGKFSDILYGSGFNAPDEFFYCEVDGKQFIFVSVLEYARAKQQANKNITVLDYSIIPRTLPAGNQRKDFLTGLSQYLGVTSWSVPGQFPLIYADTLRKNGIEVKVQEGDFFPQRAVKNPVEIEKIQAAEKATEDAMMQIRDMIASAHVNAEKMLLRKNGEVLTSEYIRSEIEADFKRKGYTAEQTIVACGSQAAAPHCIGEGPIFAGHPIVCDIFPRSDANGYWGDMTRTFCKGKAAPIVLRAYQSVLNAQQQSLKMLKAGVIGAKVHENARALMEKDGFKTIKNKNDIPCGFIHGLGHGVGLDIHEQPRLSPSNPKPLPAHCVVSVEPGLYDPAWGGIRIEDLVEVTDDGYRNFCTMDRELEIP